MAYQNRVLVHNPDLAWQRVEDNVVVVTPRTRQIHILSGSAIDLWELTDEPKTFSAIHDEICQRYAVDAETALADLEQIVAQLTQLQIIEARAA